MIPLGPYASLINRIQAPTGMPPRAWTAQEKADCAAAMREILALREKSK